MARGEHIRTLDEEGIPDLEGPLPGKAATGDGQEGVPPPSEVPASLDFGTTLSEQREGESLDRRVSRELSDVDAELEDPEEDPDALEAILVEDDEGTRPDTDADLAASAVDAGTSGTSAEEAAVQIDDEAPGATDDADPGYVSG